MRALQVCVALASLVPILAGGAGVLTGAAMLGAAGPPDLDSHLRYLSGLLLAIGLAYAASVPRIAAHRARFRLLGALVVTGGLARLFGMLLHGVPSSAMLGALVMELVVTPLLTLWQGSVADMDAA